MLRHRYAVISCKYGRLRRNVRRNNVLRGPDQMLHYLNEADIVVRPQCDIILTNNISYN